MKCEAQVNSRVRSIHELPEVMIFTVPKDKHFKGKTNLELSMKPYLSQEAIEKNGPDVYELRAMVYKLSW